MVPWSSQGQGQWCTHRPCAVPKSQLPLLLDVRHSWRLGLSGVTFLAVAEMEAQTLSGEHGGAKLWTATPPSGDGAGPHAPVSTQGAGGSRELAPARTGWDPL